MEGGRRHILYQRTVSKEDDMRRLCGLMIFCIGIGMIWVLILPKSFFMVLLAMIFMIVGYNLFC